MNNINELLNELKNESSKCISCGFCDSVCPTYKNSGYDMARTARGRAQSGFIMFKKLSSGELDIDLSDTFYSCLDCHVCLQVCPTGIDAGKISDISKMILSKMEITKKDELKLIVKNIMMYRSPMPLNNKSYKWFSDIEFDNSETLLYTGLMYQLMPYSDMLEKFQKRFGNDLFKRLLHVASRFNFLSRIAIPSDEKIDYYSKRLRSIVMLLKNNGIKFDFLGYNEPYPGTLLYDYGFIDEFLNYINYVYDLIKNYKKIITVDPHTYNILKYVYKNYIKNFNAEIIYYLDLLKKDKLKKLNIEIAFHDPCNFEGRKKYDGARKIAETIAYVRYPDRNNDRTFCCGGPDELLFPDISRNVSYDRYTQLAPLSKNIVTSCPICLYSLSKNGNTMDLIDIISMSYD